MTAFEGMAALRREAAIRCRCPFRRLSVSLRSQMTRIYLFFMRQSNAVRSPPSVAVHGGLSGQSTVAGDRAVAVADPAARRAARRAVAEPERP